MLGAGPVEEQRSDNHVSTEYRTCKSLPPSIGKPRVKQTKLNTDSNIVENYVKNLCCGNDDQASHGVRELCSVLKMGTNPSDSRPINSGVWSISLIDDNSSLGFGVNLEFLREAFVVPRGAALGAALGFCGVLVVGLLVTGRLVLPAGLVIRHKC